MNADERMHKNIIEMSKRHLFSRLTEEEMHQYAVWLHEECNDPVDEIMWLIHHCIAPDKEHITIQIKQVVEHLNDNIKERSVLINNLQDTEDYLRTSTYVEEQKEDKNHD